jgi:hypothetical protein
MCLSGRQDEIDRPTFGIDKRMDLGGESAAGTSHATIVMAPFLSWPRAGERGQEESIMMTSPSKALETAPSNRSQTPALRHRTNRL